MAVNYVQSNQVTGHNGVDLTALNFQTGVVSGQTVNIPTAQNGAFIVGAFWRIPVVLSGTLIKYEFSEAFDSVKPQPDALKILRVKWDRESWDFAILDTDYVGTTNTFGTLADGLGGALAIMPTVTIPFPIIQDAPVTTTSAGSRTFVFAFPNNPNALTYSIPWPWFNGAAGTPAYSPATQSPPVTVTTPAQFVSWANTNWSNYGTWSYSGNIVKLLNVSSSVIQVTKAGVLAQLTPKSWCLDCTSFSTPAAVDGLAIGSSSIIPFGAFMATNANMQTLINAIKPHFEAGAVFTIVGTKINILTVLPVLTIYNNTTLVKTATAGVCS
jgi:hypothetical protein